MNKPNEKGIQTTGFETIEHLAAIVSSSDDAIISKDLESKITSWNYGAEKIFGYKSDEVIGQSINILIPKELLISEAKLFKKVLSGKRVSHYKTTRLCKDGQIIDVSVSISPIFNQSGHVIGMSKIARDISSQILESEALVIANKKLKFEAREKAKRAAELLIANRELAYQRDQKANRAAELVIASEELAFQRDQKANRAAELVTANEELAYQRDEKASRAAELVIANEELAFQIAEKAKRVEELTLANAEKASRAAELVIANEELAYQRDQKANRAAELVIANEELAFQIAEKAKRVDELTIANAEKASRAAELVIANEELAYQRDQKANRAAELVIANKELAYQRDQKANRAAELIIANEELAFQMNEKAKRVEELTLANTEKANRAAELVIANEELAFQRDEKAKRVVELLIANKEKAKKALELSLANKQLQTSFIETIELARQMVELRDPYTANHEKHVGDLAKAIAKEMGLSKERQQGLLISGYLHDIGKIIVPVEILSKPGKISDQEYNLVKNHVLAGYDLLKEVTFPWPVAQIVLEHHERLNGSGYPNQLNTDQISLEGRILAVADVVDAMSSHRPYRAALGVDLALAEIKSGSGTLYDSAVVDACKKLFKTYGYKIDQAY
jgi:PAS domain S-box-containing protein/putative nucleotidyltransferase with HDIG domain